MITATMGVPDTMRAAQGRDYGPINEMLSVQGGIAVPKLTDLPKSQRRTKMLIKVLAVSLAPGDCRVLSGKTREIQGPPSFPYVPGGDCCGIVMELPEKSSDLPFKVGDRVAARFVEKPLGALAEYAIVSTLVADKVPASITSVGAAALASASPATVLAERIQKNERVLVLGAGGGMGSHFCQILRKVRGASVVVGVGKDADRLKAEPVACDDSIDYNKTDPWLIEEYQRKPFDVIVDLAAGGWPRIKELVAKNVPLIVKPWRLNGRYITTSPDEPIFEIHTIWEILNLFLFKSLWRALISRTWWRRIFPGYTFGMSLPDTRESMTRTLSHAESGKLAPVFEGPFQFTTEGVRKAFLTQESRHANGKVVIQVSED